MSSCQNLAVDVGFGIGLIPFPGLLYFFGWYRYRKNLGTGLGQSSTKKKSGNRSQRKFGTEKSIRTGLGENLVLKKVSEKIWYQKESLNRSRSDFWVS